MKLLITGATGHLGANLVREALADGHEVRALARSTSNRGGLEGLDCEVVAGDLLAPSSLRAACEGIEVVLHAAAVHRNWAADEADIIRPSVEGVKNVLDAAADAGVRRVVHTSSNATIGYPPPGEVWDESHVLSGAHSAYIRAKCKAERIALAAERQRDLEVVVTNPCGIFGPWDLKLTPSTRGIVDMAGGGPAVIDVAVTHVQDVARGHLLAAHKGRSGERYILAGDNLSKEQAAALMSELCGIKVKAMSPPWLLMRLIAWNEERKARKNGTDAGLTADQLADVYGKTLFYDSTKAKTELGWEARGAREVMLDTLSWLAVRGHLPDAVAAHVVALRPPDPDWPTA